MSSFENIVSNITGGDLLGKIIVAIVLVVCIALVSHMLVKWLRHIMQRDDANIPQSSIFINIVRGIVWGLGGCFVLDTCFDVNMSALIAALGVGGIAISLGFQDTISNLIGGLSLMVGRVVKPGDLVDVAGFVGEVTDVSWRATTVRNRLGDEQVIPNSVLNKTALEHLTLETESLCEVSLVVAHGADLAVVEGEILDAAREMRELLNPDIPPRVFFSGADV